jgi:hypothetical protein
MKACPWAGCIARGTHFGIFSTRTELATNPGKPDKIFREKGFRQ